jgi:23S rRNA (adenine2503-C2)-methyltransferase
MALPRRITDLSRLEWIQFAEALGHRGYRGEQIFEWVHGKGQNDPSEFSNIPADLRSAVSSDLRWGDPVVQWNEDRKSTTDKLLLSLEGGDGVEAVLINEESRTTVCLSSQVGCPVACRFCASGLLGLKRNLTTGEILDQYHSIRRRSQAQGRRISNIVMMGMGEPLLNYDAVLKALDILHDPKGPGIGARHLTISTVGLRKGVERLLQDSRPYSLAFSLHAPNDQLREHLVPFEGAMSVRELVEAAEAYLSVKGREVTFEYVLLDGVNTSPAQAAELAQLLRGVQATVNLIPYNENPGLPFRRPEMRVVDEFVNRLRAARIKVSVRKRKGNSILAACGQLRLRELRGGPAEAPATSPAAGTRASKRRSPPESTADPS